MSLNLEEKFNRRNFVGAVTSPMYGAFQLGDVGKLELEDGKVKLTIEPSVEREIREALEFKKLVPEGTPAAAASSHLGPRTYIVNTDGCFDIELVDNPSTGDTCVVINASEKLRKVVEFVERQMGATYEQETRGEWYGGDKNE